MPLPTPSPLAGRPALVASLALALAACGTPRPVAVSPAVEVPAPPPVADPALPPRPEPAPPPEAPPEPAPPPPAPQGTVEARSVYPQVEGAVAEWALSNGATVVYAFLPGAEAAYAVAFGDGAALVDAPALSVDAALALVAQTPAPPDAVTAVVAGGEPPEAVEGAVGRTLGGRWPAGRGGAGAAAPPPGPLHARVDLDDDGALLVLEEALRRRAGSARIDLDTRTGAARLALGGAGQESALGPFSRDETEAARDAVLAAAVRSPEAFGARALADLYRAPGARRPARPPAYAFDRLRRVRVVSPEALSALAARFAAPR